MYASIMVNLDLFKGCTQQLYVAVQLAERFHAHVIGVSACRALQAVYKAGTLADDVVEMDVAEVHQRTKTMEEQFRDAFSRRTFSIEWRSQVSMESPLGFVLRQAAAADLVITGLDKREFPVSKGRCPHTAGLIMHAGRPVMAVPESARPLHAKSILVAWKDTREARRAIADALPFLQQATHVVIAGIAEQGEEETAAASVADVVSWLRMHHVTAKPIMAPVRENTAKQLQTIAEDELADLIVAGAYGHARLHEWAFGGVTRDLLRDTPSCLLMSH